MESTGIYWKSPYAALEAVGIRAKVVNARHVKHVPGRKTDVGDAHWLAMLARAGLLRASFVPPAALRELRLIARQRQKLVGQLASEKNRLHKVLTDSRIRLGVVVSDLHGQSARAMVKAIIAGHAPQQVIKLASRRLKASREEILDALQGELSASHRFVLDELMRHIEEIEARISRFDARLLEGLESERDTLALMQTIPGIDQIGAAMLLVEIGADMDAFGSADRLASWVGVCPGNNESAGKRKSGHTRKGNPYVRRLLCGICPRSQPDHVDVQIEVPGPCGQAWLQTSDYCDWPQRCCARCSSCLSDASITGIARRIMKRSRYNATLLAGSRR